MELLPLSIVRPTVHLLTTTLSAHFRSRPQDGFLPTFTDLIFTASNIDHPNFDHSEFVSDLQQHFSLPRPSLTAPAYANLVREGVVSTDAQATPLGSVPNLNSTAVDMYRPLVVSLLTVRKLLLAIQSLPDALHAQRRQLEYLLVSQHLMEKKEFDHVSTGLGYAGYRPSVDAAAPQRAAEESPMWQWWKRVESPAPNVYDSLLHDEEQGGGGAMEWKAEIDIEWKDKPTLWGLAAQLRQRPLAEVMMHAFNLADHDLESSPMQSNVVAQQRVLAYLCSTTTIQTPLVSTSTSATTAIPCSSAAADEKNTQQALGSDGSSHLGVSFCIPRCVPLLCRPMLPHSSSLMLLQHFLGEDTAWRWCAEAFLHLQTGRVTKAGATNTVIVGEGGNSSIAAASSVNSPTADPLQPGVSSVDHDRQPHRIADGQTMIVAGGGMSDAMSSGAAGGGAASVNFLRVGSVYSTSLLLAGITKHWPEDILPPELLSSTASSPELLGTAACADYFVTPTVTMLFEMAGILYQLRPKVGLSSSQASVSDTVEGGASCGTPTFTANTSTNTTVVGKGATTLIPQRVRHALAPVLRQTLWYFHTQSMIDNVANLYLFDEQWPNDFSPLMDDALLAAAATTTTTGEMVAATESSTDQNQMSVALLAHLQQQYRWKAWVEHHLWLFPVLLHSARHQLSTTSVQGPDPLYTVPQNAPDGSEADASSTTPSSSPPSSSASKSSDKGSSFVLPPPPKPTVLSVSAAAALSLETLLSGLLSAVLLWQRSVVFQTIANHQKKAEVPNRGKSEGLSSSSPGVLDTAVSPGPLAEAVRPFLRRIAAQYLPATTPRSSDGRAPQRLLSSNWKYRHVVYLLAILNTMLFPLECGLAPQCTGIKEEGRGEKKEDSNTNDDGANALIARSALVYPEMAPLLSFCAARLTQAEEHQNYLQERATSRDIALLLLYASELLQSDIQELCVCVRLPRGAQQARAQKTSVALAKGQTEEDASPARVSSAPLQGIYDTCWSMVHHKASHGGFTRSALERLRDKAKATIASGATVGTETTKTAAAATRFPSGETIALLENALKQLPTRLERPLYAL